MRQEREGRIYSAIGGLNGEQLYVVAALYYGLTEREIAKEMSIQRGRRVTRDRVHRVKLTVAARLRRELAKEDRRP